MKKLLLLLIIAASTTSFAVTNSAKALILRQDPTTGVMTLIKLNNPLFPFVTNNAAKVFYSAIDGDIGFYNSLESTLSSFSSGFVNSAAGNMITISACTGCNPQNPGRLQVALVYSTDDGVTGSPCLSSNGCNFIAQTTSLTTILNAIRDQLYSGL